MGRVLILLLFCHFLTLDHLLFYGGGLYLYFLSQYIVTKTRMTVTRPDEYGVEETVTELVPGKLLLLIVCCACVVKYQTCI